jgi:uncharacterized protein YkwD
MTTSRFASGLGLITVCILSSPASAMPSDPVAGTLSETTEQVTGLVDDAASALGVSTASADPMVGKINRVRRRSGRRPLRASARLTRSSRRFGRYLMRADRFGHDSHIWGGGRYRRVGEVLAMHYGWRARRSRTIRGWMNSSGHRAVLLGGYRMVGVARVRGRFGSRRATIWVAQVAR